MGVVAEHFSDDKGLVWPKNIAPYDVYLARLGEEAEVLKAADNLYKQLTAAKISVIYDDRDVQAGEKLTDADLMGIPTRLVVSDKTVSENAYELKNRKQNNAELVSTDRIQELLTG